jgi:hypothetical protein
MVNPMRCSHPAALLLAAAALGACGGSDSVSSGDQMVEWAVDARDGMERSGSGVVPAEPGVAPAPPAQGTDVNALPATAAPTLSPMLIRTGTATVRVDTLERAIAALRGLAQRHGGIVGAVTLSAGDLQARHATIELRIPSERFDSALGGLAPIGRVEGVNVTAEDVGEQFADLEARAANARRLEARLIDLLERRTGRLEEMLQVEREVARVREEIERYDGRVRYLRTRAAVSVLTVTLREPQALIGSSPGERPLLDAVGQAWRNLVALLAWLIAASGILLPLALLGFLLWRGWARIRRATDPTGRRRAAAEREAERPDALP